METKFSVKRLVGLDLFRIFAALFVFLFHTEHIKCTYGILQSFISMGATFMTGFFMLSGFSLYYVVVCRKFHFSYESIVNFYRKRLIRLMPIYLTISTIWVFFFSKIGIKKELFLLPVSMLGIESVFTSLFNVSHYGGTWFISCILFCYFIFPLFYILISKESIKYMYILCVFVLVYSPFVVEFFKLASIYSNPYFRTLEFLIGMIICNLWLKYRNCMKCQYLFSFKLIILEFLLFVAVITYFTNFKFYFRNYMLYNIFCLPFFSIMIFSLAGLKNKYLEASLIIKYLSNISYVFFLAQFFVWRTTPTILRFFNVDGNIVRILTSFTICLILSILFYECIDKPLNKYFNNKLKAIN